MAITSVTAVALAVVTIAQVRFETAVPRLIGPIPAAVDRLIPPGACVLTDQVSVTLAANRFESTDPRCPQMVDTLGTTLALSHGLKPSTGAAKVPAVNAAWNQAFASAQYVILSGTSARRVPWTPQLKGYLASHFNADLPSPAPAHRLRAQGAAFGLTNRSGNHPDAAPCSPGFVTVAW
jgi:hypothetical protein